MATAARPRGTASPRPRAPSPRPCALLLLLLIGSAAAADRPRQSPEALEAAAEAFLEEALAEAYEEVEVTARGLDGRLSLRPCNAPLEAFIPHGRDPLRASTVGVRCTGEAPWTVYVRTEIEARSSVLVAARPLQRGARLRRSDVSAAMRDVRRIHGQWYTDPQEVVGQQVRRRLRQGEPLTASQLEAPVLVERGERVLIEAGRGAAIRITSRGRALDDGRQGERVRVENLDSGQEIEGRVIGEGRVRVGF
ncbi:flagellar basal body P-ring formation chaperone FlgA [Halorhodospira neutriphila]|uniref:Flagella basal body P-ring formation protein FlgA n=1 Tax=Halorhodospira neutriphila TaxID=168379 RepID=A0ABS1E7I2_9GAMM|nr:flagellar basal body P-ring formation chaperone FlgA [Halorhodospira neutriphila]MBK1726928.1 flagella basal body P-ring formation protein FlgA [Halorhodospira neutriphila]